MPLQRIMDHHRAAFSIKELLIVILIVGTLTSVVALWLNNARMRQAQTQSTNNLKQFGLSAHSFHDANKRLPFNGSSVAVNGVAYSVLPQPCELTSGSWFFQISSYMDSGPTFAFGRTDSGYAVAMCPGRGRPSTTTTPSAGSTTPPWSDYIINPWINDPKGGGGITTTNAAKDNRTKLVDITDGTSNTIFVGHGQINTDDYRSTIAVPGYIDSALVGGTTATALSSNPAAGPVTFAFDSSNTRRDAARGWGGPFPQGCLMSMCDATVRMFPYSMEVGSFKDGIGTPFQTSLASFLTPTGGEVITLICD